jgi:hypothetical protein
MLACFPREQHQEGPGSPREHPGKFASLTCALGSGLIILLLLQLHQDAERDSPPRREGY